jgi:outer membrane protein OmpA-like peptidoglycan-associated protein
MIAEASMKPVPITALAVAAALAAGGARAAGFQDCPFAGPMPDYAATAKPQWENWDTRKYIVTKDGNDVEITPEGAVCTQTYDEKPGKTDGSALEIGENYKESWEQMGAEIGRSQKGYVVGHLNKDGKEYWLNVNATRDDGYTIQVIAVEPLKRSLAAPSGNDYRLLGHMPGFVAQTPTKKNFDEHSFPTEDGSVAIRGALYSVEYEPPAKAPEHVVTDREIIANYRAALNDLHAQILRDSPDTNNITARLDDQGKTIWIFVDPNRVVAVEEKPFKLTVQPPTADAMKDKLDKDGHIALYVNFDFDKATLKPDAQPIIAQIVDLLKRNPDLKVSIDGHTDSIGGHDYNVKLSQDRAAAVVTAIAAAGIDAGRLTSSGYGPDKPIAPNDTDDGRAKNRRVELVKAS